MPWLSFDGDSGIMPGMHRSTVESLCNTINHTVTVLAALCSVFLRVFCLSMLEFLLVASRDRCVYCAQHCRDVRGNVWPSPSWHEFGRMKIYIRSIAQFVLLTPQVPHIWVALRLHIISTKFLCGYNARAVEVIATKFAAKHTTVYCCTAFFEALALLCFNVFVITGQVALLAKAKRVKGLCKLDKKLLEPSGAPVFKSEWPQTQTLELASL